MKIKLFEQYNRMPREITSDEYSNKLDSLGTCKFTISEARELIFITIYDGKKLDDKVVSSWINTSTMNLRVDNYPDDEIGVYVAITKLNDNWYLINTIYLNIKERPDDPTYLIADEFEEVINYLKKLKDEN